jgi:adenylate cyclase
VKRSKVLAPLAIALAAALAFNPPLFERLNGLGLDALFWLRHHAFGPRHAPADSPTVVVAIDEETYRRPPFADTPRALWAPHLATILNALLDAEAKVVAFDVIYPTSIEAYVPGLERAFLAALRRGGRESRVLLGLVQHQEKPVSPFRGQIVAAGAQNLRALNLVEDGDGIIRRAPLDFARATAAGTDRQPAMAVEIAARFTAPPPPGAAAFIIDFAGGNDIPTYSFADLAACAEAARGDYFRRHFAGKAVLIGTVLDVEDRKLTSKRFITAPERNDGVERCVLPPFPGVYRADLRRDSVPGVYIHAAAANTLIRRDGPAMVPAPAGAALAFLLAAIGAVAVGAARLSLAAATAVAAAFAWTAGATVAFQYGAVVPWLNGLASAVVAFGGALAYRFGVTDRERRRTARAFALYLPAAVIERALALRDGPTLGGEVRRVSILFSDIANYARLSERLEPTALVTALNEYFATVTGLIEAHGGFVDKFIGDAVVAVFGAPFDEPAHADKAVAAALAIQAALQAEPHRYRLGGGAPLVTRIGINSGEVLIGNIGSPRRFNYTVMGDAVNLASRVEGVNKRYGTVLLLTDATRAACGPDFVFREVDTVAVKGRSTPVTLYEPLGKSGSVPAARLAAAEAFAAALALWRAGQFAHAQSAFAALAPGDPVAAAFAERAMLYLVEPPAAWQGVTVLTEK